MKVKCLSGQEVNERLQRVGLRIGYWNRIALLDHNQKKHWINRHAPKGSRELYVFAQHIAGWLPKGDWKILQFDNSSGLFADEAALVGRLLLGLETLHDVSRGETSSFLFEFGSDKNENAATELLISNLIHAFLFFESHGQVASSGAPGQYLSLQDGFVYFISKDEVKASAEALLKDFDKCPESSPQWVLDIITEQQSLGLPDDFP